MNLIYVHHVINIKKNWFLSSSFYQFCNNLFWKCDANVEKNQCIFSNNAMIWKQSKVECFIWYNLSQKHLCPILSYLFFEEINFNWLTKTMIIQKISFEIVNRSVFSKISEWLKWLMSYVNIDIKWNQKNKTALTPFRLSNQMMQVCSGVRIQSQQIRRLALFFEIPFRYIACL